MRQWERAQMPGPWGQQIIPLSRITRRADQIMWRLIGAGLLYLVGHLIAAVAAGRIPMVIGGAP